MLDMNRDGIAARLLPLIYFLIVSFPHHYVSYLYDKYVLVPLGMDAVQYYADIGSAALLVLVLLFAVRLIVIQKRDSWKHLLLWAATIVLMILADRYLVVNNIERIHFPQYAMLAILLMLTLHDSGLVFFVTCFAGFVDEFQQYVTNPNHTNYLDFNDIVLNILGAALGLFVMLSLFKAKHRETSQFEKSVSQYTLGAAALTASMIGLLMIFGRLVPYAHVLRGERHVVGIVDGKLSFILSFQHNESFWTLADNGKSFHEMTAGEGIAVVLLLIIVLRFMIRWIESPGPRSVPPMVEMRG